MVKVKVIAVRVRPFLSRIRGSVTDKRGVRWVCRIDVEADLGLAELVQSYLKKPKEILVIQSEQKLRVHLVGVCDNKKSRCGVLNIDVTALAAPGEARRSRLPNKRLLLFHISNISY